MKNLLAVLLVLTITKPVFSQTDKDAFIYNLPMVGDSLQYSGSVKIQGRTKAENAANAKKWLYNYFKANELSDEKERIVPSPTDTTYYTLFGGITEFKFAPGYMNYTFYELITIKIGSTDDGYTYKISHIYVRPKSTFLTGLVLRGPPEYFINLYKQKHWSLITLMSLDKNKLRKLLHGINDTALDCVASLNKAMTN